MPIKMTGSVRPTRLNSPDPVSMPIINKLPALKAKVIDIRDNGPGTPAPVASPYAAGLFIETDYQSVGDTRATLDTATGLEWLDLTETTNMSINQVSALLSTTYAGWRFPTVAEVDGMYRRFFDGHVITGGPGVASDVSVLQIQDFRSKFGIVSGDWSYGIYPDGGSSMMSGAGADPDPSNSIYHQHIYATHLDWSNYYAGVFLVSDGGTTLSSQNNPNINTPAV